MSAFASFSVTDRFSADMVALRRVLFKHCMSFGQPVVAVMLAVAYLRRTETRFQRLMERFRAGKLMPPAPRKPQPKRVPPKVEDEPEEKPKRLSRAFGWLVKLIRPDGFQFADQLRERLAEPETQAAMAAGPQLARLFRPVCQMFGIKDEQIDRPRRKRAPKPPTPAQQERQAEREEAKRQRELAQTSSKKSVVPKGHSYPVTERDWAIWGRRNKRNERRWRAAKKKSA